MLSHRAAVLLAVFVSVELAQTRPMLDVKLFLRGGFLGAQIAALAISASIFSVFIYLHLYLQNVLGYSPLEAGMRFLPLTLFAFVVAAISGNLTARIPARWLMGAGLAVIGVSLLLMARVDTTSSWTVLLPGFVLGGIGIGLTNPALASTAVVSCPGALRHGIGNQHDVSPDRDCHGHCGARRTVPEQHRHQAHRSDGTAPGHGVVTAVAAGHFPPSLAQPARAAFIDSLGLILTVAVVALADRRWCSSPPRAPASRRWPAGRGSHRADVTWELGPIGQASFSRTI